MLWLRERIKYIKLEKYSVIYYKDSGFISCLHVSWTKYSRFQFVQPYYGVVSVALIAPFRGLRYNIGKISRLEDVVTPPYDVIDLKAQQDFLEKNPYNMIKLDLSKNVTPEEMTDQRYQESLQLLETWIDESVLTRDEEPAIYLYYIDYNHPSGRKIF